MMLWVSNVSVVMGMSKHQYVNIASRNPNVQACVILNNRCKDAIKNKRTNRCKNTNIQIVKTQTYRHTMSKHKYRRPKHQNTDTVTLPTY